MIKSTVSKKVSHLWKYCRAQGKKGPFLLIVCILNCVCLKPLRMDKLFLNMLLRVTLSCVSVSDSREDRMMMNLLHLVIFDLGWCPSITYPSII